MGAFARCRIGSEYCTRVRVATLLLLGLVSCNRKHGDAYNVQQLYASGARTCAAMKDGSVRVWGRGPSGAQLTPAIVPNLVDASFACLGDGFVCALSHAGHVACTNGFGAADDATGLACGAHHVCVLSHDHVRCGTTALEDVPGAAGAKSIAAGGATKCAVFDDGTARCWGAGKSGQLGDGHFEDRDAPSPVLIGNIRSISVGPEHTCVVLRNETAACFGANDDGELGTGDTTASATPKAVHGVDIATDIACGAHHTCARMGDSTVHCWGRNDVHQSGVSSAVHLVDQTLVIGLYEAESVAAGDDFTCVRMKDGWLRCFGVNDWGQLADGTTELRNVPTPIHY
jgi:Regulator of chromosome condensation (RCC1) repeat